MSNLGLNSSAVFHTKAYKNALIYWYLLAAVSIAGVAYLLPLLFRDFWFLPFFLLYICVAVFNLVYIYRISRTTKLLIYPWGVEYYSAKFQLTSSWDDIDLARNRTILTLFSPVRLTMKKPLVRRNLLFDWDIDILYGNARYFIPMTPRIWDRYNELMELIKLHRPDLLIEEKS
jgi:hypothetical protein